ncbi:hypothetical protein AGLY_011634 [Aphis glycines]|uniref:Peptidase A2 domain-containing protein n=1 Tax=Aphis glycines TaxID=307491 RepID=A0A6G0TBP2_APHGL|nr:hypothetical protein AGLY_011634 [Aphis glycines]
MQHLIGCLQGPAADAIRNIPVSADNYDLAWSTLSSRFHRPRLVANGLIDKLLNAPMSSQETLSDLNNFVSTFSENIALLNALKIKVLGSFILFSMAFRCLPASTRKLFESSTPSEFPSVTELLTFVQSRVAILEIAGDHQKSHRIPRTIPVRIVVESIPLLTVGSSRRCRSRTATTGRVKTVCATRACRPIIGPTNVTQDSAVKLVPGNTIRCFMGFPHVASQIAPHLAVTRPCMLHQCHPELTIQQLCYWAPLSFTFVTVVAHGKRFRAIVDSASQISAITVSCSARLGLRLKKLDSTDQWPIRYSSC